MMAACVGLQWWSGRPEAPGKSIMIFGSGTIVEQLANMGLIDEYQIIINPVVLGKGKPLFNEAVKKTKLKLVDSKPFKSGSVLLRYQPA